MTAPRWARPLWQPTGRPARLLLFVFSSERADGPLALEPARHLLPEGGLPAGVEVTSIARGEADWSALLEGPVGALAAAALGDGFEALRYAAFLHRIMGELPDPRDLAYLQGAWALAHALCDAGALAVLDAHAIRWEAAAEVRARGAQFALGREITIVFESERREGEDGHLVHTRGLCKFGRPDLVLRGVARERKDDAGFLLERLAHDGAFGLPLAPGTLDLGGRPLHLEPFADEGPLQINLNNDALLVTG